MWILHVIWTSLGIQFPTLMLRVVDHTDPEREINEMFFYLIDGRKFNRVQLGGRSLGRRIVLSHCGLSAVDWTMNFKSSPRGRRRLPPSALKTCHCVAALIAYAPPSSRDKRPLCARDGQSGRRRNSARVPRMLPPVTEWRSLARRVACRD